MFQYLVSYQVHIHTPTHPKSSLAGSNEASPEQKQQKTYQELDKYLSSIGQRSGQGLFTVEFNGTADQLKIDILSRLTYPNNVALRIYYANLAATHH